MNGLVGRLGGEAKREQKVSPGVQNDTKKGPKIRSGDPLGPYGSQVGKITPKNIKMLGIEWPKGSQNGAKMSQK